MTAPAGSTAAPGDADRTHGRGEDETAAGPPATTDLRLSEALVLAAGTTVAVVAWASLVLANLGAHSLPAVVALSAAALAVVAVLLARVSGRPRVQVDRDGLLLLAGIGLLAAVLSIPGFPYGVVDKDPGVYVVHAQAIAREGSITIDDEVAEDGLPVTTFTPGARFPGIWQEAGDPTTIRPQFFHLYPALLATADDVAGPVGTYNVNSLLAVLSAMVLAMAVRRAFGLPAGAVAGVLLATNMLQVWQAKYPTTEVLAQLLLVLALLGAATSLETRWRPPALLAGLALSLTFLARPDGVLLVLGGLGAAAAIVALRGWDRRIGWFLAGIAVALPHASLQAWRWSRAYSDANDVPTPLTFLALTAALLVGAAAYRLVLHHPVDVFVRRLVDRWGVRTLQVAMGVLLALGTAAFLLFLWNRERLLGHDLLPYNDTTIRSYDEINLERLSWFVTVPALVLLCLGVLVLGVRRWRGVQWLVVLPTVALLPVYLWSARISPRLMWWGRRYVPSALVGIVILVAIALAFAWAYRGRWWPAVRIAALLVFLGLVATYLSQSLPLVRHRELAGTAGIGEALADLAGDEQGVFLWAFDDDGATPGRDLGAVLWLAHDQRSVLLPRGDDALAADAVAAYQDAYPDAPVFVITPGDDPPPPGVATGDEPVERILQTFPFWEEPVEARPTRAGLYGIDLSVWEVEPAGG